MRLNAKELIAEARKIATAPTLPPAAAKLMTAMADRLDLQFVALCESRNEVKQLAAESYTNLQSAARELNTSWVMHKTMLGAQAALLCLSQGDIRGARDWLEGTTDEAFAEIPDDMTPSGLQAWFDSNMTSNDGHNGFLTQEEALEKLRQRAPATDAILASLRAEGVDMAMEAAKPEVANEFQRETFDQCVTAAVKYPQSDLAGKVEMVAWLELFAAQLRSKSEVQS